MATTYQYLDLHMAVASAFSVVDRLVPHFAKGGAGRAARPGTCPGKRGAGIDSGCAAVLLRAACSRRVPVVAGHLHRDALLLPARCGVAGWPTVHERG